MESGSTPPAGSPDNRIPRGALIIVVIGLLATIAAALLSTSKGSGEAAHLEFVQQRAISDSKPVAVPGSKAAKMQLIDGKIQATGTNVAGYSLFRVVSTLKIDKGAPVDEGDLFCTIHAPKASTEIARSSGGLRMLYPRSSEDGIYGQPVPETVLAQFSSHGDELALLEEVDDLPERWTTVRGVKLEWPKYEVGTEHLDYTLPSGKAQAAIELPFYTIWKSTKVPAAEIACRVKLPAGNATTKTEGALLKVSPPINEEAEEEAQEEREEAEEASGESEASEGE
jgi:hypothetical protein